MWRVSEHRVTLVLVSGWGMPVHVWDCMQQAVVGWADVICLPLAEVLDCSEWPHAVPEGAVWCGWSLGGLAVLDIAKRWPQRLAAVLLLAATPCFVQRPDWSTALPDPVFSEFAVQFAHDAEATLRHFSRLVCQGGPEPRLWARQLQALLPVQLQPAEQQALQAGLQCLRDRDLRSVVAALTLPLLWIGGGQDALVPVTVACALSDLYPGAQTRVLSSAAHVLPLSHVGEVAAIMRAFVQDLPV